MELSGQRILVTGGAGFLGQHLVRKLLERGVNQRSITIPRSKKTDLRQWRFCQQLTRNQDVVIHLAGNVGGIGYNRDHPGELFYDNLLMGIQLVEAARQNKVKKFVAVGTICAYPKFTPVPFKEVDLWRGYPEETNAPYGLAKKMLLVQAQAYRQQYGFNTIYLLPVNLYGPGDEFSDARSHVVPALIKKIDKAKQSNANQIIVWGTGEVSREFLYVEDAAEGIVLATERYEQPEPVNLGSGEEITIARLVQELFDIFDYRGQLRWDSSKPDGQPRRCLDVSRAKKEFGFQARTPLRLGLEQTVKWYLSHT